MASASWACSSSWSSRAVRPTAQPGMLRAYNARMRLQSAEPAKCAFDPRRKGNDVPQYLVIGTHAPSQCPGANQRMGEIWRQLIEAAPAIGEKRGVKRI